jgi:hypothetical protein
LVEDFGRRLRFSVYGGTQEIWVQSMETANIVNVQ